MFVFLFLACLQPPEVPKTDCGGPQSYVDADGDGYGLAPACGTGPGLVSRGGDCDDEDASSSPIGTESCTPGDEDCDGLEGDADPSTADFSAFYTDTDGDGYGAGAALSACAAPTGSVAENTDCNDQDAAASPSGTEVCTPGDEDCDGLEGDSDPSTADFSPFYADTDGDGYGAGAPLLACAAPSGYVAENTDCDDLDAASSPTGTEVCAAGDEDCDSLEGDSDPSTADFSPFYADTDGDGYGAGVPLLACAAPSGYVAENTDCNDQDAAASPAGTEVCAPGDEDCDGLEGDSDPSTTDFSTFYLDGDGDGYGSRTATRSCTAPSGYVTDSTDCNDFLSYVNPGADEVCNYGDEDCDGLWGEDDPSVVDLVAFYADSDGDGFGAGAATYACTAPAAFLTDATDCDDSRSDIHPRARESCLAGDEDCDGLEGEADPSLSADLQTFYYDSDGDGYGMTAVLGCAPTQTNVVADGDCNEYHPGVHPGAEERCNFMDDNCDGLTDDDDPALVGRYSLYPDADGDFYGEEGSVPIQACTVWTGYWITDDDCDDSSSSFHPGAADRCDGLDQDCSGVADDNSLYYRSFFLDSDGDGYGDPAVPVRACTPTGATYNNQDCDDSDATISPVAIEYCDGIDQNCNGTPDDSPFYSRWWEDADGDGDGNAATLLFTCTPPAGYVQRNSDCDDSDPSRYDQATEICDGIDQDCDGLIDENPHDWWFQDNDGDGHGESSTILFACTAPAGYVASNGDCDDSDPTRYTGAPETCDGVDNNCNSYIDEATSDAPTWYHDRDGDGYGWDWAGLACTPTDPTWVDNQDDCDDQDVAIHPAATESCDGRDNDCDGAGDLCLATGEISAWASWPLPGDPWSTVVIQDETGDGVVEVVMATTASSSGSLWVFDGGGLPNGLSGLRSWSASTWLLPQPAVTDYDADGAEELAILAYDSVNDSETFLLVSATLADGADPTAQPWIRFQAGTGEEWLGWGAQTGDYDGDGVAELALPALSAETAWIFAPGSGGILTTSDAVAEISGIGAWVLSAGLDQDGDGMDELWLEDYTDLRRLPGPISGSVDRTATDIHITGLHTTPEFDGGDLDGDGLPELVVADYEQVYILPGQPSSGELSTVATVRIDLEGYSSNPLPALGDFDGDGQTDLALGLNGVDQQAEDGGQILFFNGALSGSLLRRDATTAYSGTTPSGHAGTILLPVDLDLDPNMDLVSTEGQSLLLISGADLP